MPRGNNGDMGNLSNQGKSSKYLGRIWGCVEFGYTLAMGYQHWEFHRIPVSETGISADLESIKV